MRPGKFASLNNPFIINSNHIKICEKLNLFSFTKQNEAIVVCRKYSYFYTNRKQNFVDVPKTRQPLLHFLDISFYKPVTDVNFNDATKYTQTVTCRLEG